ncbi:MAG: hypothetical protein H6R10_1770 [Rhodocyclaceae bacterium]|nr:hypothetical protein [Rhodocyclaceae bacterium]
MPAGLGGGRLFGALRNLMATVVAIGRTRLQLLGTELQEEKTRFLGALVSGVVALFLGGLGIILLIACVAAAFWEHRVAIFGLSALVTLGVGFYLAMQAKRLVSQPSNLFHASLAELDADVARLRKAARDRQ